MEKDLLSQFFREVLSILWATQDNTAYNILANRIQLSSNDMPLIFLLQYEDHRR